MSLFRREKKPLTPDRRKPENAALREELDTYEKRALDVRAAHLDKQITETDRRLLVINANVRALKRRAQ